MKVSVVTIMIDVALNCKNDELVVNVGRCWCCYRYLGPPTFFHHPALSTIPFLMGHDNQQWRDFLGDLGPICRWRCFKHHLLKAESTASFLSYFLFISDLFISLSAWLCHASLSCHYACTLALAQLTHSLSLIIMLTLICHFHLLL